MVSVRLIVHVPVLIRYKKAMPVSALRAGLTVRPRRLAVKLIMLAICCPMVVLAEEVVAYLMAVLRMNIYAAESVIRAPLSLAAAPILISAIITKAVLVLLVAKVVCIIVMVVTTVRLVAVLVL